MSSTVDGLPGGVIWVAPSHDHVIVATGFPPCMVHFRSTLLPAIIGPTGVCVIVGDVVGWSEALIFILHYNWISIIDNYYAFCKFLL